MLLSSVVALASATTVYASDFLDETESSARTCYGTWKLSCETSDTCGRTTAYQQGYVTDGGCFVNWGPHKSIGCSNPGYKAVTVGKSGDDRMTEWYFNYTNRGRCPVKAVVHTPGKKVSVFKVEIQ